MMAPLVSVLIPTRDRLPLLRQAIETVRRQDFADWEVIVSDNASSDDVITAVTSLGDPRIRCIRSSFPVPVTENWNRALEASTGRWLIMLGDDDGLLPGTLARLAALIDQHQPDAIYVNGFVFTYPAAVPNEPGGSVQQYGRSTVFGGHQGPFFLDRRAARRLVQRSARFEMAFTFNMQHSVLSRDLVDRLRVDGAFYHSPYPDFYATNAVFWAAARLLIVPERLVVIGLSPKSFGSYFFNRREGAGVAFLGNESTTAAIGSLASTVLPGSPDRTSWLLAMAAVRDNITDGRLAVDRQRYRRLVMLSAFGGGRGAIADPAERQRLLDRLGPVERHVIVPSIRIITALLAVVPARPRAAIRQRFHRIAVRSPILRAGAGPQFRDMIDVFERAAELPTS